MLNKHTCEKNGTYQSNSRANQRDRDTSDRDGDEDNTKQRKHANAQQTTITYGKHAKTHEMAMARFSIGFIDGPHSPGRPPQVVSTYGETCIRHLGLIQTYVSGNH